MDIKYVTEVLRSAWKELQRDHVLIVDAPFTYVNICGSNWSLSLSGIAVSCTDSNYTINLKRWYE